MDSYNKNINYKFNQYHKYNKIAYHSINEI